MHERVEESPSVLILSVLASHFKAYRCVCEDLADHLRQGGWGVESVSKRPRALQRVVDMIATVWTKAREYDVAYVDVFSGRAFLWAEAVCTSLKLLHKPYVLTLRGGGLPELARRQPKRTKRLFDGAAAIVAPSEFLADRLRFICRDIIVVDNPLNVSNYTCRVRDHVEPKLVWLRSFHSIYNPSMAVRVVTDLLDECPDVLLRMTGPDKGDGTLAAIQAAVRSNGAANHIVLQGGVPKARVADELNKGDIFLNTASVDNTPVSVLEAMASGLCVVSTDVGGISYLLEHEKDALLVPPDDPLAMSKAVRRLLNDPNLARELSANARSKAERRDWSMVLPTWKQILSRAAANGHAIQAT